VYSAVVTRAAALRCWARVGGWRRCASSRRSLAAVFNHQTGQQERRPHWHTVSSGFSPALSLCPRARNKLGPRCQQLCRNKRKQRRGRTARVTGTSKLRARWACRLTKLKRL